MNEDILNRNQFFQCVLYSSKCITTQKRQIPLYCLNQMLRKYLRRVKNGNLQDYYYQGKNLYEVINEYIYDCLQELEDGKEESGKIY